MVNKRWVHTLRGWEVIRAGLEVRSRTFESKMEILTWMVIASFGLMLKDLVPFPRKKNV